MTGTADGNELRQSLNHTQKNGLKNSNVILLRRLALPYRRKVVGVGSWISKRRAGGSPADPVPVSPGPYEKDTAPKGPPLPGEVPDEA